MPETTQSGLSDKAAGAIAYITFLPAIVFLFLPPYNTRPFVRFHCWQSIFLNITAFVVDVLVGIVLALVVPFLPFSLYSLHLLWVVEAVWLLVWILCVVKAVNGETFKVPVIGAYAEKLANQ
jgi:uncharacterized membrane protein